MKPRLRNVGGHWECFGATYAGTGPTPMIAWMNWLRDSLARYDFA